MQIREIRQTNKHESINLTRLFLYPHERKFLRKLIEFETIFKSILFPDEI